jgi:phosphoglycerol transferase MdoB-like AlkP superfamily enzyme
VFVNKVLLVFITTLYIISFIICSADIPFFKQFFSRFSVVAFIWFDTPGFVFKMIFQEIRYFAFSIVFIAFAAAFVWIVIKLYRRFLVKMKFDYEPSAAKYLSLNISLTVLLLLLSLLGARGRIAEKSPIQIGTAYFSDYAFINQMGLNPVFTFMRSYLDSKDPEKQVVKLMDDKKAIDYVRTQFKLKDSVNFSSPIIRLVNPTGKQLKANVVVVIMESLSAELMQRYGNSEKLTPFLDSLANNSYCFDSIYTAGIHTMNGIYSTLFSFPALFRQHTMNIVDIPEYTGFSKTLKNEGYKTIFFTCHDDQFDNAGGFLKANSFDKIISQKDYPSEEVLSTLGVPDHYLFEYSIKYLSEQYKTKQPFFAAFMTSSNHGPYIIPKNIDFKPQSKEVLFQTVEYSEWSLRHFLKLASKEKWFDSTIFVFIADHGQVVGESKYDMPLTYHHSPLIIYSKMFTENKVFSDIGGQIDVFPTVMGLLNIKYSNNTMGVDMVSEKRKYIYFSSDDLAGCLNSKFFYIYRQNGGESLYLYRKSDPFNYINDFRSIADSMKSYTFSMLQTTQWMLLNKKTGDPGKTLKTVN